MRVVSVMYLFLAACSAGAAENNDNLSVDNLAVENLVVNLEVPEALSAENAIEAPSDVAGVSPEPAAASDVPSFDYQAYCREVANVSGGSYTIEAGCRDMEMDALSRLQDRSIPDRVLNYCTQVATVSGPGSYSLLDGCVDMELGAASRL